MASRCSRPVAFIVLFQTMAEIDRDFIPPLLMKQRPFLLYYFVYCNYFNVLYSASFEDAPNNFERRNVLQS